MDLRTRIRNRDPIAGNWVGFADPAPAELSAALGFDFVVVDAEHTTLSAGDVAEIVRGVDGTEGDTDAVVRLADGDPTTIKRALDVGVSGIVVPMVESAAEAEAIVEATRYPPEGIRGVGAGRDTRFGLDLDRETLDAAGEDLAVMVQIESEPGLAAAPEIAAVDGIDALFVGPADLSRALGIFGEWEGERFRGAVGDVIDAARDAGIAAGTLAIGRDQIETWVEYGFDFVVVGFDADYVAEGSRRALEAYTDALADRDR